MVLLGSRHSFIPFSWRQGIATKSALQWKDVGNAALKEKSCYTAMKCYTEGLESLKDSSSSNAAGGSSPQVTRESIQGLYSSAASHFGISTAESDVQLKRDLHRNRAYVNLFLERYDAAKSDALAAIQDETAAQDEQLKKLNAKSYFRAGVAAYKLREFDQAKQFFEKELQLVPFDVDGKKELKKTECRLAEQNGKLDLASLRKRVNAKHPRQDVGDFIRKVEIRDSPGKVHGLFATEDIQPGQVFMYEKAFSAAWEHEEKTWVSCKYDARIGDGMRISNQVTWQDTVSPRIASSCSPPGGRQSSLNRDRSYGEQVVPFRHISSLSPAELENLVLAQDMASCRNSC